MTIRIEEKAKQDDKLRRDITTKMAIISRNLHKAFGKDVEHDLCITRSQWGVVALVAAHPGASQRDIAQQLEMSEAAAGRLIDRLCKEGFIERRQRQEDRRAYSVHLTEKGQPIPQQMDTIGKRQEAKAFKNISDEELEIFSGIFSKIYNNIIP